MSVRIETPNDIRNRNKSPRKKIIQIRNYVN